MVENDSQQFSMSPAEVMQLDSTKRCLFPVDDDTSLSDPTKKLTNGFERPYNVKVGTNQQDDHISPEETRDSPISVVCVFSSGHQTLVPSIEKTPDILASSTSRLPNSKENLSFDGVEEQTVIEVQYVEAEHQNHDIGSNRNLLSDNDKNCTEKVQGNQKLFPSNIKDVRARPLLDIERTPLRSDTKMKKNVTPTTSTGCGNRGACLSMCGDNGQLVERTITGFLEDSSVSTPDAFKTTCTDWQAWSYFGFGKTTSPTAASEQNPSKENIRTILRHRASHSLKARKSNVKRLKQNLAPFAQSPARSPARAPGLFRNRSFSVSEHRSAIVRVSQEKKHARRSFADVLELCTMYESIDLDSPDPIRKHTSSKVSDDELLYDSDPEDFTRRRRISGARPTAVSNTTEESPDCENCQNFGRYQNSYYSPSRSLLDVHNDDMFCNIVQEIFNKTTTLVLHPISDSNKSGSVHSACPIAVDAWLERGQHLAYALIQPKWIWKAKPILDKEGQSNVRQKFRLQGIELLDITRILKMEETERGSKSFAKPSHCFFIKSIHDEEFCFEAKSTLERDRVVSSLKLLIARFGAKVLTGDPQVYYEFFWINDVGGPGDAPDLHETFLENVGGLR